MPQLHRSIEKTYHQFLVEKGISSRPKKSELKINQIKIFDNYLFSEYRGRTLVRENICVGNKAVESFHFIFCWEGDFSIILPDGKSKNLSSFQNALFYDKAGSGLLLSLPSKSVYRICTIAFFPNFGESSERFFKEFKDNFVNHMSETNSLFVGKPDLKIVDHINKLSNLTRKNLAKELKMMGVIYQVLGEITEQMISFNNKTEISVLTVREMKIISAISQDIRDNPEFEYTISYLSRQTGLLPSKLQSGFKSMHNRTVIEYIRHVRLEKATKLMKTTDLNISEIVYSIGFTSRSYFSKIFKQKYKCSPSSF